MAASNLPWESESAYPQPESSNQYFNQLAIAASFLKSAVGSADVALVLGSGLGNFVNRLQETKSVSYSDIPFMQQTHVPGHSGKCVVGTLPSSDGPLRVMCFAGRVHAYEGWRPYQTNFMARMASLAGCRLFILTNSAGCAQAGMGAGSIMVIRDHLRTTNVDPVGDVCHDARFGPRSLKGNNLYSSRMAQVAKNAASKTKVRIFEGVYSWNSGPTYETPSEVQAGIALGVGCFGMSTVPEVIAARAMGMEVFAVSMATNMAAGLADEKLTHGDVQKVAQESGPKFEALLAQIVADCKVNQSDGKAAATTTVEPPQLTLPLAPVSVWQPSLGQLQRDAKLLQLTNMSEAAPSAVVFLFCGHSAELFQPASDTPREERGVFSLVHQLQNLRVLALRDLPCFSKYARSASANSGRIIFGTTPKGHRLIVIPQEHIEGFSKVEAGYLVQLSAALGARSAFGSYIGRQFSEDAESKLAGPRGTAARSRLSVDVLTDTVDRVKGNLPIPVHPSLGEGKSTLGQDRFSSEMRAAALHRLAEIVRGRADVAETVMHAFNGPTLPTNAELSTAVVKPQASTVVAGLTTVAAMDMARALGMQTLALSISMPIISDDAQAREHAYSVQGLVDDTLLFVIDSAKLAPAAPADAVLKGPQLPAVPGGGQEEEDAAQENHHTVSVAVAALSQFVKSKTAVMPDVALLLEGDYAAVASMMNVVAILECKQIPGWTELSVGGAGVLSDRWQFVLGTVSKAQNDLNPRPVIALIARASPQAPSQDQLDAFHRVGFAVRMFQVMGVKSMIMATSVCSCQSSLEPGTIAVVRDHVNLTGVNPLYGLNDDRWGDRFPDMSGVYPAPLRKAALDALPSPAAAAPPRGRQLHQPAPANPEIVVGQVHNRRLDSTAEGRFAAAQKINALVAGCVPQAIRAAHGGLGVCTIAVVTQTVAGKSASPLPVTKQILDKVAASVRAVVLAAPKA